MHRLKSWFGLNDWDGPSKDGKKEPDPVASQQLEVSTSANPSPVVPNTDNSRLSDSSTNTEVSDAPVIVDPVLNRDLGKDFTTQVDLWLRQFVPLQPNECLSCKLIGTSAIFIAMTYGVRATHRMKKHVVPKTRKWFLLSLFSAYGLGVSMLYQRWTNSGMFEPAVEGEGASERLERIFLNDLDYYKNLYGRMRSRPIMKPVDNSEKYPVKEHVDENSKK